MKEDPAKNQQHLKLEEKLRVREAQLTYIHELGGIAGIDINIGDNIDGSTSLRSPEYIKLHGLIPGQEHGTHDDWVKRLHPDDREQAERVLKEAIAGDAATYENEYRIIRPIDNQVKWIYAKVNIERDGEGKAVRLAGVHIDVTERKETEERLKNFSAILEEQVAERTAELERNRKLLQATLDSTRALVQVFKAVRDAAGNIVDFIWVLNNEVAYKIYGDVIGKSLLQNNPGVLQEGIFKSFAEVVETGIPQHYEKHYVHEQFNGWFYQSVVKLNDGVATSTVDITDRKKAEEERFKNLKLLQQTEESALMGSWEYDLKSGAFTWSDGMYKLFDLRKDVAISPEIYLRFTTTESRRSVERLLAHLKKADADFDDIIKFNINGIIKILRIKSSVLRNAAGDAVKVLGIDTDMTAAKLAEETIRQMEAEQQKAIFRVTLSSQEEERKRIAESLHNGLGQLLYGVKISLTNLDHQLAVNSPDEFLKARKYTDELLAEAIRENRRISHELMPIVLEDFGLREAVKDICQKLSGPVVFDCKFIGFPKKFDKYIEIAIYRIVQELMLNVIKHAEAATAGVVIEANKKATLITVADNGKGFDQAEIKGKGIGISTIRSRVNLLNGKMEIASAPDAGTIITIRIPN